MSSSGSKRARVRDVWNMRMRCRLPKIPPKANWRFLNLDALLLVFFSIPFILLYIFVPSTFEVSWKGRARYVIFVWLVVLEIFLSKSRLVKLDIDVHPSQATVRFVSGLIALLVPTAFTLWQFVSEGRSSVTLLGRLVGAAFPEKELSWPLAFESVLFACSFILSVWLLQNRDGLRRLKISLFFIGSVATFFMIDAFFYAGTAWLLQLFVPPIVSVAAFFLNSLGYPTTTTPYADGHLLLLRKAGGHNMNLQVYWPCAGVHSLVIYTFLILLFFKNAEISKKKKFMYIIVGAIGTFMANTLRIVSIGIIGAESGPPASHLFHEYFGELFFIAWIVVYMVTVFLYESRHKTKISSVVEKRAHGAP